MATLKIITKHINILRKHESILQIHCGRDRHHAARSPSMQFFLAIARMRRERVTLYMEVNRYK